MAVRRDVESIQADITRVLLLRPEESMYADVLDLLRSDFDSEYGFFGYINSSGDLVCPSMTRHIFPRCQVPDKDIVFPRASWGGLWGRVLLEKTAHLKNEAHQVPEGHLPIHRSCGCPILLRGGLVGSVHLANRPDDFDESDLQTLQRVCDFMAPYLAARLARDEQERMRKRTEEELRVANAELAGKVAELERLNEAFIDREERMIELKQELARLRGERSEP